MSGSMKLRVDGAWVPFTDTLLSTDRQPTVATPGVPNAARVGSDGGLYVPRQGFRYTDLGIDGNVPPVLTDIVIGTTDTTGDPDIYGANTWDIGWLGGDQSGDYGLVDISGEIDIGIGGSIGAKPKLAVRDGLVFSKHSLDDEGAPAGNVKMCLLHDSLGDASGTPTSPFVKGVVHLINQTTFTFLVEMQDAATGFTLLKPINATTPWAWAPGSRICYHFTVYARRQ